MEDYFLGDGDKTHSTITQPSPGCVIKSEVDELLKVVILESLNERTG